MKFRILKYTSLDTTNNNIYIYIIQTHILLLLITIPNQPKYSATDRDRVRPRSTMSQRYGNWMKMQCIYGHIFYLLLRIRNIIIEYATCDQFRESMKKSTALGIFFIDSVRLI